MNDIDSSYDDVKVPVHWYDVGVLYIVNDITCAVVIISMFKFNTFYTHVRMMI